MHNKLILDWGQVNKLSLELARTISISGWMPERIVGIDRGGLPLGVMLSHYFGVPFTSLAVSLRDSSRKESNLNLPQFAVGIFNPADEDESEPGLKQNILIVDDINDTGATQQWIKEDWRSRCIPEDEAWDHVWHNNVRFATLIHNESSTSPIDYSAMDINKAEKDVWVVFPWENWWTI